jgi:hypothetical protein
VLFTTGLVNEKDKDRSGGSGVKKLVPSVVIVRACPAVSLKVADDPLMLCPLGSIVRGVVPMFLTRTFHDTDGEVAGIFSVQDEQFSKIVNPLSVLTAV